ncbi:hypothetical protein EXU57_16260 [Segetibacter sp. 3557_3]|uniref:DUF5522 domain-containing protein n=1 Tax=Segetibacter sp. 3557_3 TaxID=2547429 RepID=UPI001058941E|nr:DUF5522 domain-containing protein [Segetibacter sp. 3557_3]TDH24035.1 hypothetical protein EXU57_16260 [Segetibacter sp. 3557_3]
MSLLKQTDYYFNPDGRMVFTRSYHLDRGYCCGNGCKHCPFDYINVNEPRRTLLIANNNKSEGEQQKPRD